MWLTDSDILLAIHSTWCSPLVQLGCVQLVQLGCVQLVQLGCVQLVQLGCVQLGCVQLVQLGVFNLVFPTCSTCSTWLCSTWCDQRHFVVVIVFYIGIADKQAEQAKKRF